MAILLLAAGIWWTVGSLARGYMVASGMVEPGEEIYADEIAPTFKEDAIAGAAGLAMLALGGLMFTRSKRRKSSS